MRASRKRFVFWFSSRLFILTASVHGWLGCLNNHSFFLVTSHTHSGWGSFCPPGVPFKSHLFCQNNSGHTAHCRVVWTSGIHSEKISMALARVLSLLEPCPDMARLQVQSPSGHIQESTNERINRWNNRSLSPPPSNTYEKISIKPYHRPWLVWLSGLSISLWTERLWVWSQVRAHAWVVCAGPCFFPSLSLSKNK